MVSVIIPVYNAAKFLNQCIESVLSQSYIDFELILINDGSTDDSGNICDYYSTLDSRIQVLHQENHGSSYSRNIGFDISKGDWIFNMDADDWIEPDMLEKMVGKGLMDNADIVACGMFIEKDSHSITKLYPYESVEEGFNKVIIDLLYSAFWNKLISRNLYKKTNARSVPGIRMWEDVVVTSILRWNSNRTVILNEPLYHYRIMAPLSITSNHIGTYPEDEIKVASILSLYFERKKNGANERKIELIINYYKLMAKMSILTPFLSKKTKWIRHGNLSGIKLWKNVFPEVSPTKETLALFKTNHNDIKIWMAYNFPANLTKILFESAKRLLYIKNPKI